MAGEGGGGGWVGCVLEYSIGTWAQINVYTIFGRYDKQTKCIVAT